MHFTCYYKNVVETKKEKMPVSTQNQTKQFPLGNLEDKDFEEYEKKFQIVENYVKRYLQEKIDYGTIPGCGNKKILFKNGAIKLIQLFGFTISLNIVDKIIDYKNALFHYHYRCTVYKEGELICESDGIANSKEAKFTRQKFICPECGSEEAVSKDKYNKDTYFCWKNKGGCGATNLTLASVIKKGGSRFDYSSVNTVSHLGQKRAIVTAVKLATGCAVYFGED